jgi:hypothetical protein
MATPNIRFGFHSCSNRMVGWCPCVSTKSKVKPITHFCGLFELALVATKVLSRPYHALAYEDVLLRSVTENVVRKCGFGMKYGN